MYLHFYALRQHHVSLPEKKMLTDTGHRAYWADAGKMGSRGGDHDFENCLNNKICAEATIVAYMNVSLVHSAHMCVFVPLCESLQV